jgi:hypothetical protein
VKAFIEFCKEKGLPDPEDSDSVDENTPYYITLFVTYYCQLDKRRSYSTAEQIRSSLKNFDKEQHGRQCG